MIENSGRKVLGMMFEMVLDKGCDEVIGMVVLFLHPEHHRHASAFLTGRHEILRQQLFLGVKIIGRTLKNRHVNFTT